jgi:hypothetical protein
MTDRVGLLERAKAAGRAHLDDAEQRSFDKLLGDIAALNCLRVNVRSRGRPTTSRTVRATLICRSQVTDNQCPVAPQSFIAG